MAIKKPPTSPRVLKVIPSAPPPASDHRSGQATAVHPTISDTGANDMNDSTSIPFEMKMQAENMKKASEDIASLGQSNIEAIMKSSQIWAAGCQAISKSMAATAQARLEQNMSAWKALLSVRSLKEAMDLPSSLMQTSFETAFAETGRITDASISLAKQTMAPITERIAVAVEKFKQPVA